MPKKDYIIHVWLNTGSVKPIEEDVFGDLVATTKETMEIHYCHTSHTKVNPLDTYVCTRDENFNHDDRV